MFNKGVGNPNLLYDDDWEKIQDEHPDRFRYHVTLFREEEHMDHFHHRWRSTLYHKVEEYGSEVFERLEKGAHIYFCGHTGMLPGIHDVLKLWPTRRGSTTTSSSAG